MQEILLASLIVGRVLDDVYYAVPDDICDIHSDTLTHKSVAALLVDYGTLLVHHVIVLNQALTNTEVVLLNLLLCALNALRNHWALNHLAILESQAVHYRCYTLRSEQTHQLIFE